jgi:pyruvate dehydrogenase E1 component alpha subunit
MEAAARKAREGGERPRPTLLETVEYRYGAHTTADDPSAYRDEAAVEAWRDRDPLDRYERYLRGRGLLDDDRVERVEARAREIVADAIEELESVTADSEDLFEDAYASPTPRVRADRERLRRLRERHGDDRLLRDE